MGQLLASGSRLAWYRQRPLRGLIREEPGSKGIVQTSNRVGCAKIATLE
jgi:hypothetical protein